MNDETLEPLPPDSKDLERRLVGLKELSVNTFYGELMGYIRTQRDNIMESVFVTPTTMEGVLARERCFGVAEEYKVLLGWLDEEISDAKQLIETLKLEEQQEKEQTNHED